MKRGGGRGTEVVEAPASKLQKILMEVSLSLSKFGTSSGGRGRS